MYEYLQFCAFYRWPNASVSHTSFSFFFLYFWSELTQTENNKFYKLITMGLNRQVWFLVERIIRQLFSYAAQMIWLSESQSSHSHRYQLIGTDVLKVFIPCVTYDMKIQRNSMKIRETEWERVKRLTDMHITNNYNEIKRLTSWRYDTVKFLY